MLLFASSPLPLWIAIDISLYVAGAILCLLYKEHGIMYQLEKPKSHFDLTEYAQC